MMTPSLLLASSILFLGGGNLIVHQPHHPSVATAFSPSPQFTTASRKRRNTSRSSKSKSTHRHRPSAPITTTTTSTTRLNNNLAGFEDLWSSYLSALESDPLLVKSVTAGVILGAADLSGQAIQQSLLAVAAESTTATNIVKKHGIDEDEGGGVVDIARFARFAFFGFILQAPWNHFYYQFLDGALPPTEDPFTYTTAIKVLIDQFIQAPIFTLIIFAFLGLLEGKSIPEIRRQLDEDYVDTMLANWKLWVPATAVNIAFCPPILRVLFLNVVFFFWSIFLSLKLNKSED